MLVGECPVGKHPAIIVLRWGIQPILQFLVYKLHQWYNIQKQVCLQVISVEHFRESLLSEGFLKNCNYRNIYMLSHAISHISFHFFLFPVSHILSFSKIAIQEIILTLLHSVTLFSQIYVPFQKSYLLHIFSNFICDYIKATLTDNTCFY